MRFKTYRVYFVSAKMAGREHDVTNQLRVHFSLSLSLFWLQTFIRIDIIYTVRPEYESTKSLCSWNHGFLHFHRRSQSEQASNITARNFFTQSSFLQKRVFVTRFFLSQNLSWWSDCWKKMCIYILYPFISLKVIYNTLYFVIFVSVFYHYVAQRICVIIFWFGLNLFMLTTSNSVYTQYHEILIWLKHSGVLALCEYWFCNAVYIIAACQIAGTILLAVWKYILSSYTFNFIINWPLPVIEVIHCTLQGQICTKCIVIFAIPQLYVISKDWNIIINN